MNFSEKKVLLEKIARLEEEKADLEIMLEAVTGHSDGVAEQLLQKVRKMVEASEKRFRLITETIPVPVLVTQETDGLIIFANHHASDLFGIPVSSLLGRNTQEFLNPAQRKELVEYIKEQGLLKNYEIQGKRADGTPFRAELTVQPFYYNEKSCLMSVWYDITEQRILENRLRQSQKMEAVGTLAGGIAHDFNNILTAIFGYTELSLHMTSPETRVHRNLKQIFHSAVRAKELVMQILSFCRQSDHVMKHFNITPIIKEAVQMLRQIIPSHIMVNVSFKSPNATIEGDPTQIQQVLMNLCSNAADAIHRTGGCIDIFLEKVKSLETEKLLIPELQPNRNYVRLSVIDNGYGMSRKLINQIFDPFFTTKPPGKGTGMGLSVVHGIIKKHGGEIHVESEPEKGTAFHVYFPVIEKADKNAKEETQPARGSGRILLIDDEDNILEAYKETLEDLGYQADISHTGKEALELFIQKPDYYDLVITDYSMPGMTGGKLAEELIRIRPNIPVILYTGHHDPLIREKSGQAGAIDFLTKPFTRNELAAMLQKYL